MLHQLLPIACHQARAASPTDGALCARFCNRSAVAILNESYSALAAQVLQLKNLIHLNNLLDKLKDMGVSRHAATGS
jgi:hypothetical protein